MSVPRDKTEKLKHEASPYEGDLHIRTLFENIPVGMFESTPDGKFIYVNPAVASMLGYSTPEELVGLVNRTSIADALYEDPARRPALVNEVVQGGCSWKTFENRYRRKDGVIIDAHLSFSEFRDPVSGKLHRFGVMQDVTGRKKAENALMIANKKLQLLGSVSRHDILNKVTVIIGYLNSVSKSVSDPVVSEKISKVIQATRMIRRYAEFTKFYQEVGLYTPLWQNVQKIVRQNRNSEITLDVNITGLEVYADKMFEMVISNLYDNSIRHGGIITYIRVATRNEHGKLVIVWEDDGNGIPDTDKEKIFERGYGKNSGLGLFLIREILSITGMTIKETGTLGTGARFEISIPNGAYRFKAPDTSGRVSEHKIK